MNVVNWVKPTAKLVPLVALFSGLSILGLFGFRALVSADSLKSAGDAVGNYLQTVGGIYAGIRLLHLGLWSVPIGWTAGWVVRSAITTGRLNGGDWRRRRPAA